MKSIKPAVLALTLMFSPIALCTVGIGNVARFMVEEEWGTGDINNRKKLTKDEVAAIAQDLPLFMKVYESQAQRPMSKQMKAALENRIAGKELTDPVQLGEAIAEQKLNAADLRNRDIITDNEIAVIVDDKNMEQFLIAYVKVAGKGMSADMLKALDYRNTLLESKESTEKMEALGEFFTEKPATKKAAQKPSYDFYAVIRLPATGNFRREQKRTLRNQYFKEALESKDFKKAQAVIDYLKSAQDLSGKDPIEMQIELNNAQSSK